MRSLAATQNGSISRKFCTSFGRSASLICGTLKPSYRSASEDPALSPSPGSCPGIPLRKPTPPRRDVPADVPSLSDPSARASYE